MQEGRKTGREKGGGRREGKRERKSVKNHTIFFNSIRNAKKSGGAMKFSFLGHQNSPLYCGLQKPVKYTCLLSSGFGEKYD